MLVKKSRGREALACTALLTVAVRTIVQCRGMRYSRADHEKFALPSNRKIGRLTGREILDSFDVVIVVVLPDRTQGLSESGLSPTALWKTVGSCH